MPKAAKGTKKITCSRCGVEKLAQGNFTPRVLTCKACIAGTDRVCGGCNTHKAAAAYSEGCKRHCRTCNENKDTAEHVDICIEDGCDVHFHRNPDTFTWRSRSGQTGNWNSKCKECCAFKGYKEPHQCTKCHVEKQPAEFNRPGECKACRSSRTTDERVSRGEAVTKETANRPISCSNTECQKPFSEEDWRSYRAGEGRWDSQCKACYNAHKYHADHRARRLAENPEAFRTHNNAVLRAWRANHPDMQAQQQLRNKRNTRWIFDRWVRQAERRGLSVAIDQQEDIESMFLQPCHYCGYSPPDNHPLNTLDRMDSMSQEYNLETSVTCCVPCNQIKGTRRLEDFLEEACLAASSRKNCVEIDPCQVDAEYRSLGHPDEAQRATVLHRTEQLCMVAKFNGFEF